MSQVKKLYVGTIYTDQIDEYSRRIKESYGIVDITMTPDKTICNLTSVEIPSRYFDMILEAKAFTRGFFYAYEG